MEKMSSNSALAPIVIFVYNRPDHFQKMIQYLKGAELASESEVFVFCDGPKRQKDKLAVQEVRDIATALTGFKKVEVVAREMNIGLRQSVISGVSQVLNNYPSAIILEDDICVGPAFLNYMNEALTKYQDNLEIWSLSGFVIPEIGHAISQFYRDQVFLAPRASSWGWATWSSRWKQAQWDTDIIATDLLDKNTAKRYWKTGGDKIRMLFNQLYSKSDSWAILWDFNHFQSKAYCLYPVRSQIRNIGFDNTGVHSTPVKKYAVDELSNTAPELPSALEVNKKIFKIFSSINRKPYLDIKDFVRWLRLSSRIKNKP